jgi:hypothetical protein
LERIVAAAAVAAAVLLAEHENVWGRGRLLQVLQVLRLGMPKAKWIVMPLEGVVVVVVEVVEVEVEVMVGVEGVVFTIVMLRPLMGTLVEALVGGCCCFCCWRRRRRRHMGLPKNGAVASAVAARAARATAVAADNRRC